MKNRILFFLIIFLAVVAFLFIQYKSDTMKDSTSTELTQNKETVVKSTKSIGIGSLKLEVPIGLETKQEDKFVTIYIPGVYRDETKPNYINEKMEFTIILNKDDNEKKLSIKEWFNENDPQTYKTSATSEYDEEKVLNNITYIESLYIAPTILSSDFYDVILSYFTNKKDIYKIDYFKKSENPKIVLNTEETKSIEEYEKIVQEILQSIRFVE